MTALLLIHLTVLVAALADRAGASNRDVNRNLLAIARCETGGKLGQNGRPDWDHRARSEHPGLYYEGALGFLETTWDHYKPRGFPSGAHRATPKQQLRVGRILVRTFGGYSSWPSCSRRLGLR